MCSSAWTEITYATLYGRAGTMAVRRRQVVAVLCAG